MRNQHLCQSILLCSVTIAQYKLRRNCKLWEKRANRIRALQRICGSELYLRVRNISEIRGSMLMRDSRSNRQHHSRKEANDCNLISYAKRESAIDACVNCLYVTRLAIFAPLRKVSRAQTGNDGAFCGVVCRFSRLTTPSR